MYMSTHNNSQWLRSIAIIVAMIPAYTCAADIESAKVQFAQIQEAIEANCSECYGASKDDFIRAVRALEKLITAGFDELGAKKLLAQSYQTWAFAYSESNSQESDELQQKAREIYLDLTKQVPQDPSVWASYARSLDNPSEALLHLKRAESLSPDEPSIQYSLGMLYSHGLENSKDGAAHLRRAADLEQGYSKLRYLEQLARVHELSGDSAKAAEIRGEMKLFEQELERKDRTSQPKN